MIFNEFLTNVEAGTSSVTIIVGMFFGAMSFASIFSSSLFNKYSMRSVGLFGGFVYVVGSFLTIFVTSIWQLTITYGILQG